MRGRLRVWIAPTLPHAERDDVPALPDVHAVEEHLRSHVAVGGIDVGLSLREITHDVLGGDVLDLRPVAAQGAPLAVSAISVDVRQAGDASTCRRPQR
jgi:hypothetical protein